MGVYTENLPSTIKKVLNHLPGLSLTISLSSILLSISSKTKLQQKDILNKSKVFPQLYKVKRFRVET